MSVTVRFLPLILLMFITVPVHGYDVLVSVTGNVIGNTVLSRKIRRSKTCRWAPSA